MTSPEFKEHIAALMAYEAKKSAAKTILAKRNTATAAFLQGLVRTPSDRGYFPPSRKI